MLNYYKYFFFAAVILFSLNINSSGQTIGFISMDQAYDSNPFRDIETKSSWISAMNVGVQHNTEDFSLSYTGIYSRFDTFSERNYYWHQAALFAEKNNFQYGLMFEQTFNSIDYEVLNTNKYSGYINSYFNIGEFNFYTNLEGNLNYFSQLQELDNFNLDAGIKMQKSFESGTTILVGSIFHFKKYLTNIVVEDTTNQSVTTMGGPGSGRQGGYSLSEYEAPSVSQFQLWLRLAQSITNSTGLALQYQSRLIVGGTSRYFSGADYNYADESQIFDDPLGYENQSYGVELTQLLPLGIVLKGSYYKNKKDYATQGIYTDAENYDFLQLREDTRTNARVTLQKRIASKFFGSKNVSINFTYQWVNNESNSYWYKYESNYTGLGFSVNF